MKKFEDLNGLEIDALRELGSIGNGNAATSLSGMLGKEVRISVPQVKILEYNEAIEWIGGAEPITAGALVRMSGEITGVVLMVQQVNFVNLILSNMLGKTVNDYDELTELDGSALVEVSNIMISTFINSLCSFADINIQLSVPSFTVDMQGAILAVPMAEYGGQSDYIMTISSDFICEEQVIPCRLLLSPDIRSLNYLLKKLGVLDE